MLTAIMVSTPAGVGFIELAVTFFLLFCLTIGEQDMG